jgi:hypothetical protein
VDDKTQKACAACGMPLNGAEDYPDGADMNLVDWCKYCGDKDSIKSYDELLKGMTEYMKTTQHLDDAAAAKAAEEYIKSSKAYKEGKVK